MPPWVSVPRYSLLSPKSHAFGAIWGRGWERGMMGLSNPPSRVVIRSESIGTRRDLKAAGFRLALRLAGMTVMEPETQV